MVDVAVVRLVGADGEHQVEHGALLAEVPVGPPVWKSKFYGAFVLDRRVVLHANVTPSTRRLLDGVVGVSLASFRRREKF